VLGRAGHDGLLGGVLGGVTGRPGGARRRLGDDGLLGGVLGGVTGGLLGGSSGNDGLLDGLLGNDGLVGSLLGHDGLVGSLLGGLLGGSSPVANILEPVTSVASGLTDAVGPVVSNVAHAGVRVRTAPGHRHPGRCLGFVLAGGRRGGQRHARCHPLVTDVVTPITSLVEHSPVARPGARDQHPARPAGLIDRTSKEGARELQHPGTGHHRPVPRKD
jgi:hypothetical protein